MRFLFLVAFCAVEPLAACRFFKDERISWRLGVVVEGVGGWEGRTARRANGDLGIEDVFAVIVSILCIME